MAVAALPRSFGRIREVANWDCVNITLGQLLRGTRSDPTALAESGRWLQRQLPIRFARRIEDFLQLPHVVVSNPEINSVLGAYVETFDAIGAFPEIQTQADEANFSNLISDQLKRHSDGTRLIAQGYQEVRGMYPHIRLDEFFNNHFVARIASRILMENYVLMRSPEEGSIGVVRQGMRPLSIVQGLVQDLTRLTRSIHGCAPEVEYRGNLDCLLDYIPRHVSYMVRELLKNALRATIERHKAKGSGQLPPVVVELQKGDVHVIIKISDHGGGMPKQVQREAWQYGWSTAVEDGDAGAAGVRLKKELAGFGFGLPLTRLHAQYFGGDVFMQALPGHGTDMYLLLTHLKEGTASTEIDDLSTVMYQTENVGLARGP